MISAALVTFLALPDVRARTAMYIGEKKITRLESFLAGFGYAQEVYTIRDEVAGPDFGRFNDWVAIYYGRVVGNVIDSVAGWCNIILEECQGQEAKAVDVFFELFDQFMQHDPAELSGFTSPFFSA